MTDEATPTDAEGDPDPAPTEPTGDLPVYTPDPVPIPVTSPTDPAHPQRTPNRPTPNPTDPDPTDPDPTDPGDGSGGE